MFAGIRGHGTCNSENFPLYIVCYTLYTSTFAQCVLRNCYPGIDARWVVNCEQIQLAYTICTQFTQFDGTFSRNEDFLKVCDIVLSFNEPTRESKFEPCWPQLWTVPG